MSFPLSSSTWKILQEFLEAMQSTTWESTAIAQLLLRLMIEPAGLQGWMELMLSLTLFEPYCPQY